MRVALIDPSLFTWPYDVALARGLIENGHEAVVYGRKPFTPLTEDELRHLRPHFYRGLDGEWARRLPSRLLLMLKGVSHISSMVRLVGELRAFRPDIIHFQWAPLAMVDERMLAPLRAIAPLVFTVHDSAPFNDNPKSRLQRIGATSIMRRFDRLIVHTEKAEQRVKSYGVAPDRIRRIAHGLLDTLPAARKKAADPAPDGRLTLLLFGQIKPYKGTDILIEAVAALPEELRRRCRLRIVGRPQIPMEPLFELVDRHGLGDAVEFDLRFIDDDEIGDLLRSADIQMFPYTEIDASGVLMLALGVGKPIVASDIGLFRELLEDGVHGALVPPGDVGRLSAALADLIRDDGRRAAAGRNVAALCKSIPSWNEIGRRTAELYEQAIAERAGG